MKWLILLLLCTGCTSITVTKEGNNFSATYKSAFRKLEDVHAQVGTATLNIGKAATDLDKSLEALPETLIQ